MTMVKTVTYMGVEHELDLDDTLQDMFYEAVRRAYELDRRVAREALGLKDKAEYVIRMVEEGMGLNELGEVQSRGTQLDMLIAERQRAYMFASELRYRIFGTV